MTEEHPPKDGEVEDWGEVAVKDAEETDYLHYGETVVANPLDFSVKTLVDEASGDSPRIYLDKWQRAYIWSNGKASRLVESLGLKVTGIRSRGMLERIARPLSRRPRRGPRATARVQRRPPRWLGSEEPAHLS